MTAPSFNYDDILNDVEIIPGTFDVMIAGSLGRVYRKNGAGWQRLKSETSFNIEGMHFPDAGTGMATGFASGHSVIMRYDP